MKLLILITLFTALVRPVSAGEMEWSVGTINGVDWAHYRNVEAKLIIQISAKSCGDWFFLVSSEAPQKGTKRPIKFRVDSGETLEWSDFEGHREASVSEEFVAGLVLGRTLYVRDQSLTDTLIVPLVDFGRAHRALNHECVGIPEKDVWLP